MQSTAASAASSPKSSCVTSFSNNNILDFSSKSDVRHPPPHRSSDQVSMDFDGLPDGDEMHSSDDVNEAKKRKGRGPTMLDYNALSKAKQIGVQFNDKGQHFGAGSASLSSSAGILARQLIPVTYASWDEVPTISKDKLWAAVKQKYDLAPCRKKILLTQMYGCWRTYKTTLTKQIRSLDDGPDAMEQMQLLKPANVEKQADWDKFAKHRCSPKFDAADVLQETIIQKVEGDVTNYTAKKNDDVANRTVFISGSQLDKVEASLGRARSSIREAALVRNKTSTHQDPDYVPRGPIYRNPNAFHRSYLEMEKVFKIYVYEEGEVPIFHDGPCRSIYSSEGRFIHEMEKGKMYRTKDPHKALVYFLPFSVVNMVQYIYMPETFDRSGMKRAVVDYINLISHKHPFWNRSLGADHFMLSCHDWGPTTTSFVPDLFHNSIRVLCNANTSEGFNPLKDASFPEINLKTSEMPGIGGRPPSKRSTLAFFAGRLHGHIRYLLLNEWKGKDQDVQVYDQLPRRVSYENMLKSSKFCLCPSGYEVASPRVVEAIYAECVPVLISDGYVPPFSDVLNWKSFSVQIPVKNISDIKTILTAISSRQYLRMQRRVKQVQRHFLVNGPPKRYDVFHMIVHSIWLRRLNIRIQDVFT